MKRRASQAASPAGAGHQLSPPLHPVDGTCVFHRGRKLSYFGGCDYLRLAGHPVILASIADALAAFGACVCASRVTTGNHQVYLQLEDRLAAFFGAGRALAVPTGYMTNAVVADSLAGEVSHVLIDKRAHPSLQDAAGRLCCPVLTFDHRDPGHVARLVQRLPRRARPVLLTDGVFARDGALAPLAEHLDALSPRGLMLVDDAHGAGVLGAHARGTPEHLGVSSPRIIQTVTLSKAFGVYGGAVLATADIVERIVQRSAMFAGSTPLPLCLAAGALTALDLVQTDAARRERLADNTRTMQRLLAAVGVPAPQTPCPILCRIPSTARASRRLEEALWARDILPPRLSYPGVPAQGYYRFAWSSEHTPGQLERLAAALLE